MTFCALHPFAAPNTQLALRVDAHAQRVESALTLEYRVRGDIANVLLPEVAGTQRRDELWQHTCAELFVAQSGKVDYCEFNFAPSGHWAAYQFDDYRQGMRPLDINSPIIRTTTDLTSLIIHVQCELPTGMSSSSLHLGLTMVIEDRQSNLSYWALTHPSTKPDFHHRDGFVLQV